MNLLYQATPDGFCGDEDTGQTSAWYVFSAIGLYPVCPGDPNYLVSSPLFDKATLKLASGKTFTISTSNNGPQKPYIQSAGLNGNGIARPHSAADRNDRAVAPQWRSVNRAANAFAQPKLFSSLRLITNQPIAKIHD